MKVRIITGPNGSGKSTLVFVMKNRNKLNMGFIVNADEIERQLNTKRVYEFDKKGNWIKCIMYQKGKPVGINERTISYYN